MPTPVKKKAAVKKSAGPIVLSCVNLKGGVGKTALAVNFAAYCGSVSGKRTLLVDLDPQTNATFSCMAVDKWEAHANKHGTVADLLGTKKHNSAEGREKTIDTVIKKKVFTNVDLVPSHLDLFLVDLDMAGQIVREFRLKQAMASVRANYDIIVCDCPPNLTLPTQNALAMSTHFVVPVSPDFLSVLGVGLLLTRIDELGQLLQTSLELAGIVISRVGRPAQHREATVAAINQQFGAKVLQTQIKERASVSKAASQQKSVFRMKDEAADTEFRSACSELFTRIGGQ